VKIYSEEKKRKPNHWHGELTWSFSFLLCDIPYTYITTANTFKGCDDAEKESDSEYDGCFSHRTADLPVYKTRTILGYGQ